jgi:hypothetical protein
MAPRRIGNGGGHIPVLPVSVLVRRLLPQSGREVGRAGGPFGDEANWSDQRFR